MFSKCYFDTFYVFEEETKDFCDDPKTASSVLEAASKQRQRLSSHTTTLFFHTKTTLAVTEFQVAFSSKLPYLDPPKQGVEQLERIPKPKFRLEYVIVAAWQLLQYCEYNPSLKAPMACLAAHYLDQKYFFKGSRASLARTIETQESMAAKAQVGFDINPPNPVTLAVEYIDLPWFTQDIESHTFYPRLKLSDVLKIKLSTETDNGDAHLVVSSLKISLLTLTSFKTISSEQTLLTDAAGQIHVSTFHDVDILQQSSDHQSEYCLPKKYLACTFPDVEPTLYSEHWTRSYALKIEVGFLDRKLSGPLRSAEVILDINVARVDYQFILLGKPACPFFSFYIPDHRLYLDIQKPDSVASPSFKSIKYPNGESEFVRSHQTAIIQGGEIEFAVTLRNFYRPPERNRAIEIVKNSAHVCKAEASCIMRYKLFKKAFKAKGKVHVWAMPVLSYKGTFCMTEIPLSHWNVSTVIRGENKFFEDTLDEKSYYNDFTFKVPLRLSFTMLNEFHPPLPLPGAIVCKGMRLSEAFRLKLSFSYSSYEQPYAFIGIRMVSTKIEWLVYPFHSPICETVSQFDTPKFEKAIDLTHFKLSEDRKKWVMDIPLEMYDCEIPDLGPTFYSSQKARDMAVRISFNLKGSRKTPLEVTIPLQICGELIDVTGHNVMPPSYAALMDTSKLEKYTPVRILGSREKLDKIRDCDFVDTKEGVLVRKFSGKNPGLG
ncbi:hypothetical protein FT663_04085 [Candidozyma haemuli var. vulneris]|nr:hypothetical protein FT663_04085 [[Candida] haemuloni var. vulneris]KAF3988411.1 hypothetical protein FT662_03444 [[Candida] haemuloni var. vulneris]